MVVDYATNQLSSHWVMVMAHSRFLY